MSASNSTTVSFPIFGLMGLLFIYLKLTGAIAWSWVWVLSPFWIPVAFFVAVLLIIFLIALKAG
jgi:hypothetical protein